MSAASRYRADPQKARKLVQAALLLFAQRGYDGVSAQALADAAGTSKANLFHHFGSKQGLYEQALVEACERFREALDRALSDVRGLEPLLARLIRWHRARLAEQPSETQLVLRELIRPQVEPGFGAARAAMLDSFGHLVARIEAEAPAEGWRPGVDAALVAHLVVSNDVFDFLTGPLRKGLDAAQAFVDAADYPERVASLLVHGLLRSSDPRSRCR